MRERTFARIFLLVAAAIVLYFVYRIFQPFLQAIALALVLATLCHPVFVRFHRWLRGRDTLAALGTCAFVVFLIVVPFLSLLAALGIEIGRVYELIQEKRAAGTLGEFLDIRRLPYFDLVREWLGGYIDFDRIDLVGGVLSLLQQISVYMVRYSTAVLGGLLGLVGQFVLIIVTMFFLLRDGDRIASQIESLLPISRHYEALLVTKFREVTQATVLGTFLTALAQGAAGGLLFWALGIQNVLFWGSLMGFFSMVPVVGTALVWVPWVIYFLAIGSYVKALVLGLVAALVVGSIDNVIRPLFIEGKARMPTLVVFFSLMGGVAYFGIVGLIFGPILVALALTFLEVYRIEFRDELQRPER